MTYRPLYSLVAYLYRLLWLAHAKFLLSEDW